MLYFILSKKYGFRTRYREGKERLFEMGDSLDCGLRFDWIVHENREVGPEIKAVDIAGGE